ncbi:hydroxymethylbilane synthase [Kitasatospora aureofaciens]|nr:hydroxymethylbilane synthase [Kitasatospora aureofaciens]ARF79808.1 hydroxymethylbilane synthase [Kitasatospora aureofaciens]OEV36195.1 hydroxymethylbilane synthase [Kitasatospora aureofaciens]QEV01034.1 hydroxymethylbilane synthase [Streptomyces viridifaciens]UKZ07375.1 hydroxymethylbilane synthase [Streptomyces viridifaciens]
MNGQPLTEQAPAAALRLGTRRSALAMAQSGMVAREVTRLTGRPVELVEITTYGDTSREALAQIGGTGVFVSALRDALLEGRIDFAVHSLKDLPTAAPEGLALAAVPEREDARDALVAAEGLTLDELVEKLAGAGRAARIGTGSPRRMAQLNAWARARGAQLETVAIRGNVDTRIGYVTGGELDAVVLATAGLNRLGRGAEISQHLDPELMIPAPGQGALAIECATADADLTAALAALDHAPTRVAVAAERALLATLEAGCSAPVAALATWSPENELQLDGVVGDPDGAALLKMSANGPIVLDETAEQQARALGHALAARLLDAGAATLMGERAR